VTHPPRRRITLGPGAEFDLIRRFVADDAPLPPEVRVGPGDDAAVLEGGWVVTTDLSVEDVHFRRSWLSDVEIGYRAAAAALSDLAAMAATPVGVLVSIAAPRRGGMDLVAVQAGVREIASEVGAAVIGGDVSASPGPLAVDIVALGRTAWPVLRDGAEPGDHVWVTGRLGAAAAAVRVWEAGGEPSAELRRAFARPRPRVREARCLVDHEVVDALIDLSDGLAGDAGHIAAASGVRITLEVARVPVAEAAVAALGEEGALDAALHGGEDYELCFVTDPGVVDPGYFRERHGLEVTRVGRVEEGEGVWLERPDGSVERLTRGGYDHLAGDGP
jgi:thiamine-monophosphate kinase